ncbi:MAG TPA: hypothetical protein V6D07_19075 [Trichocoleus sp.]
MGQAIKTELRDFELRGTATHGDAIALSALFMVPEELSIMRDPISPNTLKAVEMMRNRLSKNMEALVAEVGKEQADKIISQDWIERVMVLCEMDLQMRTVVVARLLEIYPQLRDKKDLIWFDGTVAGHRLEPDELLLDLIMPALQGIMNSSETETEERSQKRKKRFTALQSILHSNQEQVAPESKPTFEAPAPEAPDPEMDEAVLTSELARQISSMNPTTQASLLAELKSKSQ